MARRRIIGRALWRSLAVLVGLLALHPLGVAAARSRPSRVSMYPVPRSTAAAAATEISFRGASPRQLGHVTVRGSQTGVHPGEIRRHGDGRGASFQPRDPFQAGERVTVTVRLPVVGVRGRRVHFRIAAKPARVAPPTGPPANPIEPGPLTGDALWDFASRPDLHPPRLDVSGGDGTALGGGSLFLSTTGGGRPSGLEILDDRGNVVWFRADARNLVTDFRVQRLGDRPVLTWWQGAMPILGVGQGQGVVMDDRYRVIRRVRAGNGLQADLHEFQLTRRRTALMSFYHPVAADLSALGGPAAGVVLDSGVQEVDLRTGRVEFEWHCLDDVAIGESYGAVPQDPAEVFDYCHVNSVDEDADGNLLISARNTHAVYLVDRRTGRLRWRMGGKRSSFAMAVDARFSWQHDARWRGRNRISLFDNASYESRPSRAVILRLDRARRRATLVRSYTSPEHPNAASQGDMQVMPSGDVLVGWGNYPLISQFSASGRLLREWRFRYRGFNSYRAFRMPWAAHPRSRPRLVAHSQASGRTTIAISWNGATDVSRWTIMAGNHRRRLSAVASVRRRGFETTLTTAGPHRYVAVVAKTRDGRAIGRSVPVTVTRQPPAEH